MAIQPLKPCLWFDDEAEEAAKFYTGIFPGSKIGTISRYTEVGQEFHGKEPGSVMVVEFELNGQPFTALNGGPTFRFNEAISFQIECETQGEIDHYWNALTAGGEEQQCGWLKDRFGVSWQVFPREIADMMNDPDREKAVRATEAMFAMKKMDLAALRKAFDG